MNRLRRCARALAAPSPRARFGAWALVVAALLLSPAWLLVGTCSDRLLANAWQIAWLCAMAILLTTTPSDAIKLSRKTSIWLITCGTAWLGISANALSTPLIANPRTQILAIVLTATIGCVLPMIAIGVVDRRPVGSAPTRSPWTHALVLWHPAAGWAIAWGARRLVGSRPDATIPGAPPSLIMIGIVLAVLWVAPGRHRVLGGLGLIGMVGWMLMTAGVAWAVVR